MAPTYVVGSRDRYPTAIAAPRFAEIFQLPVASLICILTKPAPARGALARGRASTRDEAAAAYAAHLAAEGLALVAPRCVPAIVSAYFAAARRSLDHAAPRKSCRSRRPDRSADHRARGMPLVFRLWRPGERTLQGKMAIRGASPAAPEAAPDLLFVPLGRLRPGGAPDRLWRRLLRPHLRGVAAPKRDLRRRRRLCEPGTAIPHESMTSARFVLTSRMIDCRAITVAHDERPTLSIAASAAANASMVACVSCSLATSSAAPGAQFCWTIAEVAAQPGASTSSSSMARTRPAALASPRRSATRFSPPARIA